MGLKRTKLLGIQAVTGISTVGILTVGTTVTAGGVGVHQPHAGGIVVMHSMSAQLLDFMYQVVQSRYLDMEILHTD